MYMYKEQHLLSNDAVHWAYEKYCLGYTLIQIADALGCCERTVRREFKRRGLVRIRPVLTYKE